MGLLEDLYQEVVLTRYKAPKKRGTLPNPSRISGGKNPSCGDEIELYLTLEDGVIKDVCYQGQGCAVSQASADLMAELVSGKTVKEALELAKKFKAMVVEGAPPAPELGDLAALAGVAKLPSRVKCTTLAWHALEDALKEAA